MRCIQTGCLAVAFGLAAVSQAQQPTWRDATNQPAVTLGPPTASLGAPRPMSPASSRDFVAPCNFGIIARGKADDKAPLPAGPALSATPAPGTSPLPAPTPLTPATPAPGAIYSGPVTSGPYMGDAYGSAMPGAPCPTCTADPSWAPLPGGAFCPDSRPCGCILYGSVEALFWWTQNAHLPPLLTSSTAFVGGAAAPATQVVFGGNDVAQNGRVGGRVTIGGWLDPCQNWGVVGSYFFLGSNGINYAATGNSMNNLARPFVNVNPADAGLRFEPLGNGNFVASTTNELWGADINARMNLCTGCRYRLDGLVGFRYLQMDEKLSIGESFAGTFQDPATGVVHAVTGSLNDNFKAMNSFYGGQVGLMGELKRGNWSLDMITKVALGGTRETLTATGNQMAVDNGAMTARNFGLLVQPTNAGSHTHDVFAVVPEVTLNLGYQLTQHMKIFAGYDFLYWSNVARVGNQVDTTLNVNSQAFPITQTPGATRPAVNFQQTGFWAQGFNVGLQFNW